LILEIEANNQDYKRYWYELVKFKRKEKNIQVKVKKYLEYKRGGGGIEDFKEIERRTNFETKHDPKNWTTKVGGGRP
jgi:hypothetical protein